METAEAAEGQLDSRAASALSQMVSDMEAQGLSPVVCSSFRTWRNREALHQNKVNRLLSQGYSPASAEEEASRWVVPAGTSEHQLGLAADIVAADCQVLEEEQENTPEQQWLMAHCQEYGFILRYPRDKQGLTGVGYELALPLCRGGSRPRDHVPGPLPGRIFGAGIRKEVGPCQPLFLMPLIRGAHSSLSRERWAANPWG